VVTASLTVWHPAVFGRILTLSSLIIDQKLLPESEALLSLLRDTVATDALLFLKHEIKIEGEGYCAVPNIKGLSISTP